LKFRSTGNYLENFSSCGIWHFTLITTSFIFNECPKILDKKKTKKQRHKTRLRDKKKQKKIPLKITLNSKTKRTINNLIRIFRISGDFREIVNLLHF